MNRMEDREVRGMAVFKLRQVERHLIELETCASDPATRACLAGVRAALRMAAEELQSVPVVITGDDEARLAAVR